MLFVSDSQCEWTHDARRLRSPASAVPPAGAGGSGGHRGLLRRLGHDRGRPQEPTCVDIPESMPLCSGIDYNKMRLPNLLEHDTLKEAQQQAGYWVPLLNLRCHADTQLFLCSLFTPVCLESPIYPCRSLCEAVRNGCESRMQTYSFPWPDMLRCDKFPLDNDMCITVQHTKSQRPGMCVWACVRGGYSAAEDASAPS
ncbi:hypothetical protein C7M84_012443 [Penaeus vannamei]|uniref:FZ domain-containing protein n=1 Tax=Penaeus vannamei TaxID=6689 RepID=A0A3R7PKC3_PENVA|nr:hypothetical protein C7M84_012443 [Penaeus vannamei]